MNLFDLGGQLLRVGRAVTPPGDRNLGAGGVPQAMPRLPTYIHHTILPLFIVSKKYHPLDECVAPLSLLSALSFAI